MMTLISATGLVLMTATATPGGFTKYDLAQTAPAHRRVVLGGGLSPLRAQQDQQDPPGTPKTTTKTGGDNKAELAKPVPVKPAEKKDKDPAKEAEKGGDK